LKSRKMDIARKRIRVVYPVTDLAMDGAQRQLLELVKGLDKSRFAPIVLALHRGGPMEQDFRRVPGARLLFAMRRGRFDSGCLLRIYRILRRTQADVVQPFLTPATLYGLLPALACRTPVKIVTERAGPGNRNAGRGYRLYLRIEDFLSRFADWAVPNSEMGARFLIQRGIRPSRIHVIYNGIDFDRLVPDPEVTRAARQSLEVPPDGKVVGMMARLCAVKNHAMFLQAAAIVSRQVPDARFALLGDGPLRGTLEQMSTDLGLASKIAFYGEQRDVASYLRSFDLLAHTSETEGCSNSLIEAMALGEPVVATDVGGNREIVRDGQTGFLVPLGDVESLANRIIRLMSEADLLSKMGAEARRETISRFAPQKMVEQYESLYEETLERKRGRPEESSKRARRASRETILLCAAVEPAPGAREALRRVLEGPVDWRYLTELARYHAVEPLLAKHLSSDDLSDRVPRFWLDRLRTAHRLTAASNLVLVSEAQKCLSQLNDASVPVIALKGAILAEHLYGNIGLRAMGDIDFLVPRAHLEKARECLRGLGYQETPVNGGAGHPFHGLPYVKQGPFPTTVELHWALDDPGLVAFPEREIWERARPSSVQGTPALVLSPEDHLLFLCYHLTKHDSQILKLLCDIAETVKKQTSSLDWEYILRSARSWGIDLAAYHCLGHARNLLGAPVPPLVLRATRPGIPRRVLLEIVAGQQVVVSPPVAERNRYETFALAHGLMMREPRRTLSVISTHRGRGVRKGWAGTAALVALTLASALWAWLANLRMKPYPAAD
jgi:glycosyltransferase involved in cell wall biosynthesis